MPKSLEHYQQESGRAGRDGLHAECTMLYSAGDAETWKYLMQDVTDESVRASSERSLRSMQRYCSSMRCRHQMLVEHFGQTLQQESCGACDVCLQEMTATPDALVVSQKILSCVIRLGEKFGAAYTAQVLRGSKVKRILENRHEQLSTWGLMKDVSETQVRHWIDQLISLNHLRQAGEYQCLQVTPTGRQVLRGELTPELLCIRTSETIEQADDSWAGVERGLFEELRALRTRLASQRGVPPYIIFSDATLRALARHRPVSAVTLQQVPGIGAKKLQELGNTVLEEIRRWCTANRSAGDVGFGAMPGSLPPAALTPSPRRVELADDYLQLFEEQLSMEEIAVQLDRTLDTVSRYLAQYVETRRITNIDPWVDPEVQRRVERSLGRLGGEKLKPLFEDLGGAVPYHELRIVAVAWVIRQSESEE
jgi:ATP-dependent DNA helicase RecQ